MTPTPEQSAIVAAFETEQDLVIQAGAGKTSTLKLCAATTRDRGAYLAYNRAIADDASRSFPGSVVCKTAHAFAFAAVGKHYAARLNSGRMPARKIAQLLGLREILTIPAEPAPVRLAPEKIARLVMATLARFCYSAEPQPRPWHVPELGEDRADLVVSTAHKAKGREWGHVRIGDDFAEPGEDSDGPSRPEAMLAYVAVTRAQRRLDLGSLAWIDDWYPVRRKAGAPQAELALAGEG